jgi:hypothetical protein
VRYGVPQSSRVARRAPSQSEASLAHCIEGWTRRAKGPWAKPQSVEAITRSRPTNLASRTMRSVDDVAHIDVVVFSTTAIRCAGRAPTGRPHAGDSVYALVAEAVKVGTSGRSWPKGARPCRCS